MERKKRVLVIEDVLSVREYLCTLLKFDGFEVFGCDDGISALSAAEKNDFHIIITDYRMPNMNGVDATRHLRTRFPLSLIIGISSDERGRDFLQAGADAFLLKPYRYKDLLNVMNGEHR